MAAARLEHKPVMAAAALSALRVRPDGMYVDATYGRGGHSGAILAALGTTGRLLAIDRDPHAVADARRRFGADPRFRILHGRFAELEALLSTHAADARLDGVLFDLGVSSPQLDDPRRGFSFGRDGPLDMRMDPGSGAPVAQWLNAAAEQDIARVIAEYGEERHARRIARAVVVARARAPLRRCAELAALCERAVPRREPGKHPATRTFQALRIFVNRELEELQAALPAAAARLVSGGRLVVISFHSLEDRIVKRFVRGPQLARRRQRLPPVAEAASAPVLRAVGRALRPAVAEIAANPRARSAVLRVAERIT